MRATLSLMGIYNVYPKIFDGFAYPSKWTEEEQETFRNKLLFDTAELEVLYANPAVLNTGMCVWSAAMRPNWDKLYDTLHFNYNPIWNKDGKITESEIIKRDNSFSDQRNGSGESHNTQTNDLDQVNTSTQQTDTSTKNDTTGNSSQDTTATNTQTTTATGTQKDYVFGFNENNAAQSEQHETENNETVNGSNSQNVKGSTSQNATGSGNEKITYNADQINTGTVKDDGNSKSAETLEHTGNDNEGREYTRIEQGNIGITTTQQMIREEREVDKFNLMDYIIDSFKERFCLMVY